MTNCRIPFCIVFFILFFVDGTACASSTKFSCHAAELQSQTADGTSIIVIAHTKAYSPDLPYKKGFRWGVELIEPKSLMTSLEVIINGRELFVPLSAYSDLTNPRELALETTKNGFRVMIKGGDAATSYKAVLTFDNKHILHRRVVNSEFPDAAKEETAYSYNLEN